jgi:hypothetical protein
VDSLHDFQDPHFPAGGNHTIANQTMGLHNARVRSIKPQDKRIKGHLRHSGGPSRFKSAQQNQEDGPFQVPSPSLPMLERFLITSIKRGLKTLIIRFLYLSMRYP